MKMNFVFGLLIMLILQSCNSPSVKNEEKELIRLSDFTSNSISNKSLYSYTIDGNPVSSSFEIDSRYKLLILNLGQCSANINITASSSVSSRMWGFATEIQGAYYNANYHYNAPINEKIKIVKFNSDGPVMTVLKNDSIKLFHTNFHNFSVELNNRSDAGIYGESYDYGNDERDADIMFYEKNDRVYLLILVSRIRGEKIKPGLLADFIL
jgi:hypothetical protein